MLCVRGHSSESRWAISAAEPGVATGSRGAAFLMEGRRKHSLQQLQALGLLGWVSPAGGGGKEQMIRWGGRYLPPPSARNEWHRLWGFNR